MLERGSSQASPQSFTGRPVSSSSTTGPLLLLLLLLRPPLRKGLKSVRLSTDTHSNRGTEESERLPGCCTATASRPGTDAWWSISGVKTTVLPWAGRPATAELASASRRRWRSGSWPSPASRRRLRRSRSRSRLRLAAAPVRSRPSATTAASSRPERARRRRRSLSGGAPSGIPDGASAAVGADASASGCATAASVTAPQSFLRTVGSASKRISSSSAAAFAAAAPPAMAAPSAGLPRAEPGTPWPAAPVADGGCAAGAATVAGATGGLAGASGKPTSHTRGQSAPKMSKSSWQVASSNLSASGQPARDSCAQVARTASKAFAGLKIRSAESGCPAFW